MKSFRLSILVGLILASTCLVCASVSLTPKPKQMKELGGTISVRSSDRMTIVLGKKPAVTETYAAERLQTLVNRRFHVKADIVSESGVPIGSGLYVYLGQRGTNGALKRLCDQHHVTINDGKFKPGNDAFRLEVLPTDKSVLVLGSNPRSVIFGMQDLFKLMSQSLGTATIPAVSIRDWPSIPWRGGNGINNATPEQLDAWAWAGFNFARVSVPKGGDYESVRKSIVEAHKRGFFVYAYRTTAVKQADFDKVITDYQKFIDAGVDGLWMSFDDYGPGDQTIPLMERTIALGKEHGMTGRKIAITPPYPDYDSVDTKFDHERAKIKGMESAVWFFTTLPSVGNSYLARECGIKTPPAWWHNWPRVEGGFSHGGYGGRSMRPDAKNSYMEVAPLVWGWHNPGNGAINEAYKYTDTVLPCCAQWLPTYFSDPFGVWAWNPQAQDFVPTREEIYDAVYGPDCVQLMMQYDDTHRLLRQYFTPASNVGALPNKFPPRLRETADRKACGELISTLQSLTEQINRLAPQGSTLAPETLETTYLEPMRADAAIVAALFKSSFPENWWWEQEGQILQLASIGLTDKAVALAKDDAPKLKAQISELDKNLSPVLNMKGYLDFWEKRVTACELGDITQLTALSNEQPGGMYKDSLIIQNFRDEQDSPQQGKLIASVSPEELIRTVENRGPWIPSLYKDKDITAVHFVYPVQRNTTAGDFCEVSMKANLEGMGRRILRFKLFCEPYSRAKDGYNRRQGMRSLQILVGNKVAWQEDVMNVYEKPGMWKTVDITSAAADAPGNTDITLRVIENSPFQSFATVTATGGSDEALGYNWFDPTSYQMLMLLGPMQVWSE